MTKPDGMIYQLEKMCGHDPDLFNMNVHSPGRVLLELGWINHDYHPREADILFEGVKSLTMDIKPTGSYQQLTLKEASKTDRGTYLAEFKLDGKQGFLIEFESAQTSVTSAPE